MKIFTPRNRFIYILLIGFVIIVAGWLYGKQDFFYRGFGMCSEAWNPRPISSNDSEYVIGCTKGAEARRDQIYFAGFVLFVLCTVGFLAISNNRSDSVKIEQLANWRQRSSREAGFDYD